MQWSFGELGVEVSGSLVAGLLAASAILVALPEGLVASWLHQPSWLARLAAIALALPAYTCSVPSIIIAGSLLARGVDPGVAIAFLIAGPATNLGELNAIRNAMGWRSAVLYTGSLIVIAFAAGMATSFLPAWISPTEQLVAGQHSHFGHNHTHAVESVTIGGSGLSLADFAWWRWPFAVGVAAMAIHSTADYVRQRIRPKQSPIATPATYGVATK
ncbi:MAG: permease, partial [Planctomycetota bacterium]